MQHDLEKLNEQLGVALKTQQQALKTAKNFSFGDLSHMSVDEQMKARSIQGEIRKIASTKFETPEQVMAALEKINKKFA